MNSIGYHRERTKTRIGPVHAGRSLRAFAHSSMSYPIPSETIRVEQDVKKSQFIANMGRAENRERAVAFIEAVRTEFPDATHNCWAYIAGPPANTLAIGMSDDGEPHGTAGRPMLNVLQHKNIGERVVVVTRNFGGVKLGAGGLVRAYASTVQQAIDVLPVHEKVDYRKGRINVSYALENPVRHLLETLQLPVLQAEYGDQVILYLQVPEPAIATITEHLSQKIAGSARIEWEQERNE